MFRNAYENQLAHMESALLKAKSEMDVAKGRAQELEGLILKKEQVISEQKVLHNQIIVSTTIRMNIYNRITIIELRN